MRITSKNLSFQNRKFSTNTNKSIEHPSSKICMT